MELGAGAYAMSFAAGGLSGLSPCVLPMAPIVIGSALSAHRLGPLALVLGLMLSFALVGTSIASLGTVAGIDAGTLRHAGAITLIAFGFVLASSRLQAWFARRLAGLSGAGHALIAGIPAGGLAGQFAIGISLGPVWAPCVGPTLGAAVTLASQGERLGEVALMMAVFGFGAGLPFVGLGLASRGVMQRLKGRLIPLAAAGKRLFGGALVLVGTSILTGGDKLLEAALLRVTPDWLTRLTTSI